MDVARAAIHAFCFDVDEKVQPVHVSRLGGFFRKYHPSEPIVDALSILGWLQEAIKLPDGYWIAAPPISVSLQKFSLLLSPQPISELRRFMHSPLRLTAYGRLTHASAPDPFVAVPLATWMRRPKDLGEWVSNILLDATNRLSASTSLGRNIEVFRSWRNPRSRADLYRMWTRDDGAEPIPTGLHIARERSEAGVRRYFLGAYDNGSLQAEAEANCDFVRLRFVVDRIAGIRMPLRVETADSACVVELRRNLPQEETRLLLGLAASAEQIERGVRIVVDTDLFDVVAAVLEDLGFEIRSGR